MAEPQRAVQAEPIEQVLPLVLEIIPGQAGEGLVDAYEPGSYEGQSLWKLCEKMLAKRNWSIEEQQVLEDIKRQLDSGRLLCRGRQIEGLALEYATLEETEAGEKYLYVPIRAIKPQEGGTPDHERHHHGDAGKKAVGSKLPEVQGGVRASDRAVGRDIRRGGPRRRAVSDSPPRVL